MKQFLNPAIIILGTSCASFLAWLLLNDSISIGYEDKFSIFSWGMYLTVIWYLLAVIVALIGFKMGVSIKIKTTTFDNVAEMNSDTGYYVFIILASIGVVSSYIMIVNNIGGLLEIFTNIIIAQANNLKFALYEDYSIGLQSLRYSSIHVFTLMVIRRIVFKKKNVIDILPLLLLLSTALVSSRLSIVMSFFQIFLLLILYNRFNFSKTKLVLTIFTIFNLLSILNISRNYGYYESQELGFYEAGSAEIINYLGSPFQGAISVGENHKLINQVPERWDLYAGIPLNLTTNSTFLYFYRDYGWLCFIVSSLLIFSYSLVSGILIKFKNNFFILIYTTIMYIFAEFWRVYLFWEGIIISLIVVPICVYFLLIIRRLITDSYAKRNTFNYR